MLEREAETGGIPRHSDHPGYGMRDLQRFISGRRTPRRLTGLAQDAGAVLETEAMVTGWAATRAGGHVARGAAHRRRPTRSCWRPAPANGPGPARLVPGDRPDGVYTTGQLQKLVHLHHAPVGRTRRRSSAPSWSAGRRF